MPESESELALVFHRRARRVLLASLGALNSKAPTLPKRQGRASAEAIHEALTLAILRFVVLELGRARGLFRETQDFCRGRLFSVRNSELDIQPRFVEGRLRAEFPNALVAAEEVFCAELGTGLQADGVSFESCPAELVGNLYELLLGEAVGYDERGQLSLTSGNRRKLTGTFFTPRALTEVVVARALEPLARRIHDSSHRSHDFVIQFRVCDPTVGGGAFLVQTARAMAAMAESRALVARRRALVTQAMYGVDINPIAVAVAEAALCLFVADPTMPLSEAGKNLRVGDALVGAPYVQGRSSPALAPLGTLGPALDFTLEFAEVFERGGFDLVIGNPPWVAYAGRAAKPLHPARKSYLRAHYTALKGYPTLHGLFVERALRLAPQGTVALLVPSSIADLDGYRAVRRAVRVSHTPREPMLEFGQDAFESVTQPCFALIAEASTGTVAPGAHSDQPFRLAERQHAATQAAEVSAPKALLELSKLSAFPRELFGEMGFQTSGSVGRDLLRRAAEPDTRYVYPLLEGKDVREFFEGDPRLFLSPEREVLAKARCRLREAAEYERVRLVVRQTARYPIAARHRGLPFRNSLLAGFEVEGLPPDLIVGLLNSSVYRALHLAVHRDARQAVFPQVKLAHLRALPAPPRHAERQARIAALSAELTRSGVTPGLRERLDATVFELFDLAPAAAVEILEFLRARVAPASTRAGALR